MSHLWKDIKTNFMYWRFRHVTRNRLRFQNWLRSKRRSPMSGGRGSRPVPGFAARGMATYVYRRSVRRTWTALLVMVLLLTAISVGGHYGLLPGLGWALSTLVVVGCVYWALRGV